jgi:hypothetical protein
MPDDTSDQTLNAPGSFRNSTSDHDRRWLSRMARATESRFAIPRPRGEVYDYPYSIPNAQQIIPGDVIVCYRAQRVSDDERRILRLVETIVLDGERLLAVYGRYVALSPARTFEEVGGYPRNNRRNAINQLDNSFVVAFARFPGSHDHLRSALG